MGRKKDPTNKIFIIKTAFALFLEKGYKEVTIQNIMDATKLSKGAIYHHFASKEGIYEATLQEYYFKLLDNDIVAMITGNFKNDVETLYRFTAEVFSKIEQLTEEGLDFPIRNFFSFQLESESHENVRNRVVQTVTQYRNAIKQFVEHAIASGQIQQNLDAEAVTFQMIGMIEGLALHYSTEEKNVKELLLKKYQQVFDSYFKMICV